MLPMLRGSITRKLKVFLGRALSLSCTRTQCCDEVLTAPESTRWLSGRI
jgi:hypothetical protein